MLAAQVEELSSEVAGLRNQIGELIEALTPTAVAAMEALPEALKPQNIVALLQHAEAMSPRKMQDIVEHTDALNRNTRSQQGW